MSDLRSVVKGVIDAADPMSLIEMGAPDDEYDSEIDDIVERVTSANTVEDIIESIDDVFEASFRISDKPERPSLYVRQGEACRDGAKTIFAALISNE